MSGDGAGRPDCESCHGAGWLRVDAPLGDSRFGQIVRCNCKVADDTERQIARLLELSGMKAAMAAQTFSSFSTYRPDLAEAADEARRFAMQPEGWLYLHGRYGCGKTHLLAAIAGTLLRRRIPTLYVVVPALLDKLRASYDASRDEGFWDVWQRIIRAEVLILDDLGAEQSTHWVSEKLYTLINDRYQSRAPLVVASNLMPGEIGGRIGSRLGDAALTTLVSIAAPDYRVVSR